jgi:hypothetical protein
MGILPAFYETDRSLLLVPTNPFKADYSFQYNSSLGSKRWNIINDLIGQSIIDVHPHVRKTWASICTLSAENRSPFLTEFSRPFITEAQAADYASWWRKDPVRARRLANDWMQQAVERYKRIELKVVSFQSSTNS